MSGTKVVLYYDYERNEVHKITHIGERHLVYGSESGYVIGYNDMLLFLGMEVERIAYRYNYTAYDPLKETWTKVLLVPHQNRRFFASVISGDVLYIAGGIGNYRIVQDNLNCGNIKTGEWYGTVNLPYRCRQLVCCDYLGSLFVMNIADKAGYLFNTTVFTTHHIIDSSNILDSFNEMFTIFVYKKDLYLLGNRTIIKMVFEHDQLRISERISINNPVADYDVVDAVVCEDNVFCLYKVIVSIDDNRKSTLAKFNFNTQTFDKIFDNISEDASLDLNGNLYRLNIHSKIIPLQYYKILEREKFITDLD